MSTGFDPLSFPISKVLLAYDPPNGQQVAWQQSPGIAWIEGASAKQRWDERQGYGLSGSFPVYYGNKLSAFTICVQLLTSQDWLDWASWSQLVAKPPAGTRPKALAIYHPWLADLNIGACVVVEQHQPEPDETGGYVIRIDCMQWRKPKIALSKPDAAKTNASTDPVDKYIDQLTAQNQKLAEGLK